MSEKLWGTKPYRSLDYYFKSVHGEKIYKIALEGGMTCPNRDGVLDTRGCIFCSKGGSGDFAAPINDAQNDIVLRVKEQIEVGKERVQNKVGENAKFVAYYQSYTNTYAPVEYLRNIYTAALECEEICGLSIATRPDCLSQPVLNLLEEIMELYPDKLLWIELGLQTIHRKTAQYIRRGYELNVFEEGVKKLANLSIPVIVHVILGLPGESVEDMLSTIEYLNTFRIFGIKLQLLHVMEDTDLAIDYNDRLFETLTMEEYIDIVIKCLERLSPEVVIHRVTGDAPKDKLISPKWSGDKKRVLNTFLNEMKKRKTYQGRLYEKTRSFNVI